MALVLKYCTRTRLNHIREGGRREGGWEREAERRERERERGREGVSERVRE
jgi:hypothetical protein